MGSTHVVICVDDKQYHFTGPFREKVYQKHRRVESSEP